MSEAEEKLILDKLNNLDAGMNEIYAELKAFRTEMNEGFNRMEERFADIHKGLDSIKEVAEGMLKK